MQQQMYAQFMVGHKLLYLPVCVLGMWGCGVEETAGRFSGEQAGEEAGKGSRSDKSEEEELQGKHTSMPCTYWLSFLLPWPEDPCPWPTAYLSAMSGV